MYSYSPAAFGRDEAISVKYLISNSPLLASPLGAGLSGIDYYYYLVLLDLVVLSYSTWLRPQTEELTQRNYVLLLGQEASIFIYASRGRQEKLLN